MGGRGCTVLDLGTGGGEPKKEKDHEDEVLYSSNEISLEKKKECCWKVEMPQCTPERRGPTERSNQTKISNGQILDIISYVTHVVQDIYYST